MSGNRSYWIKPAVRTVTPTRILAVAVRARLAPTLDTSNKAGLVYGHAGTASAVLRGGSWRAGPALCPGTASSLLRMAEEAAPPRGAVLVVAPLASHVLTLAGWHSQLKARGAKWSGRAGSVPKGTSSRPAGRHSAFPAPPGLIPGVVCAGSATDPLIVSSFVDRGKPDIIRYHVGGKTITWISGRQFFDQSEESLAETLGFKPQYPRLPPVTGDRDELDPCDRAALWLKAFTELCTWWRGIDGGPLGATPGGSAWSFVRKRLKPKTVLSCQEPDIRKIEELSLFGGEANTWFYGPVQPTYRTGEIDPGTSEDMPYPVQLGPLDHWDVSGMYPNLLASELYPTRYLYQYREPSVDSLRAMLDRWCVIATVVLRTDSPDYPVRHGDRVIHPVGHFVATLTTPDLVHAVASGSVVRVVRAVTYVAGRPFQVALRELLAHRAAAVKAGKPAWELFVKLLSNSFGGRLAMRSHGWRRAPGVRPVKLWGEWIGRNADTGETRRYRSRGGLVDVWQEIDTPTRPLAACFAHLTAYGRSAMRELRATLPPRSVVSQDTDGVWLLRHAVSGRTPGDTIPKRPHLRLRLTESSVSGRWYGPRHYRVDSGWTLAGMHDPRASCDGLAWDTTYSLTPKWTPDNLPPVWIYECQSRKRLGEIPADGTVGPDGWTKPFSLWQE